MAKLMTALKIGGNRDAIVCVSRPRESVGSIFGEVFEIGLAQKFIWYPDLVLFFPPGRLGDYWTEIYTSATLELQPETVQAIVVPFTIRSDFEPFIVSNKCDNDENSALYTKAGNYQLLFEARYLTVGEATKLAGFDEYTFDRGTDPRTSAPELIRLTLIPTDELLEPQILRADPGFNPPQTLSLNSVYEEPPDRTDIPLVLSSHVTPATLEFVDIIEQTLQEFYQIERPHLQLRRGAAFGDPEDLLWAEALDLLSVPPFAISIKRDGSITLGQIEWGRYGQIHHVVWQLEHTIEAGFSWSMYDVGLIRCDAEDLQRLLLVLQEKTKRHF